MYFLCLILPKPYYTSLNSKGRDLSLVWKKLGSHSYTPSPKSNLTYKNNPKKKRICDNGTVLVSRQRRKQTNELTSSVHTPTCLFSYSDKLNIVPRSVQECKMFIKLNTGMKFKDITSTQKANKVTYLMFREYIAKSFNC